MNAAAGHLTRAAAAVVVSVLLGPQPPAAQPPGPYRFATAVPVGGEGGWDYLSVDPSAHRLYVTHGSKIVVIDTRRDAVIGEIDGTPGVHGFAVASELRRGFATNGADGTVSIVDLDALKTIARIPTGENPDGVAYEPGRREVYVFNKRGRSAAVLDARTGHVVARIPDVGNPESVAVDSRAGRVFFNIEDKSAIGVIDTATHALSAAWPIAPGVEGVGLAIDTEHHRLFVGTHNRALLMLDSANGAVMASVPIDTAVDSVWYDPGTQFAFSSNGEGTVTVAHEDTASQLSFVQTISTRRFARTMALDPGTHTIYVSIADYEAEPATPLEIHRPLAKEIPGTFRVMVYRLAGGASNQ
jgi:YVTN family beta-propeller protein